MYPDFRAGHTTTVTRTTTTTAAIITTSSHPSRPLKLQAPLQERQTVEFLQH